MTEALKQYEKSIRKKHSFNWTPKFEAEIKTDLNKAIVIAVVTKVFEKLGWDLVFQEEEKSAEAKSKTEWRGWTEKITVVFDDGKLTIKSISLLDAFWDNGKNYKRVQLFIHAFQQTEKEFDQKALAELKQEIESVKNWDDYEIPESLPKPKFRKKPQFWIPVVGGILTALLLGFIVAFLSVNGFYMVLLFEAGVAIGFGLVLKHLIKLSNYTVFDNLRYLLIAMVILTYLSNQYFQYQIVLNKNDLEAFSFLEFMQTRLEAGLRFKDLNTGWIGLLISWGLQLGITYLIGSLQLVGNLTAYRFETMQMEVVNFAYYHFVIKGKTGDQTRRELSKMGWTEKEDQNEIFKSIGALRGAIGIKRME